MKVMTREFTRLLRRTRIADDDLLRSINEADRGLIEAEIGRHLIKQRIAREGAGKSGGFRTILYYRRRERAIFLHLFPKNEKGNLSAKELSAYREFAKQLDELSDAALELLITHRRWRRIGGSQDQDLRE